MPYRYTNIRIVDPSANLDSTEYRPFSLYWAAVSAAEETLQGGPLTASWLKLFQDHLSQDETTRLRWRGDLAESTEMRRAYSAMYGRFFGRGVLASRLGFSDFIPLERNRTQIGSGVEVVRVDDGDIPDWIAWDPDQESYVLVEAKGSLTGSDDDFLYGSPACVDNGKAQFDRVEVRDSTGSVIETRNWVVANLWTTDTRERQPVSLLWDPSRSGRELSDEEKTVYSIAIREHRVTNIAAKLRPPDFSERATDDPGLTLHISVDPSDEAIPSTTIEQNVSGDDPRSAEVRVLPPIEEPSDEAHVGEYLAAIITPLGFRPILDDSDFQAVRSIQDRAREEDGAVMIYGLATTASTPDSKREIWLSGGGIVIPDGACLFKLQDVEFRKA